MQSFYLPTLPEVAKLNENIRLSALFSPTDWQGARMLMGIGGGIRSDIILEAKKYGAHVISPYHLYVNDDFVREAHVQNLAVIVWTVNESVQMKELLEHGVDGLITDYPDRLQKVWAEYKNKPKNVRN